MKRLYLKFTENTFFIPWIALAWLSVWFVFFVLISLEAIDFRYAWNYAEPVLASAIFNFDKNPFLYGNIHEPPYVLYPYTPLYAYLSYGVSFITGDNFASGRWVTFASAIGLLGVMRRILKYQGVGNFIALCFPALILGLTSFTRFANVMQADVPALFLGLLGLFFFIRFQACASRRDMLIAIIFFTGAFLTKQNYVLWIIAAVLSLWAAKQWRESVLFIWVQGICVVFPLAVIVIITKGDAWAHIWTFHTAKAFDTSTILPFWLGYLKEFAIIFGVAVLTFLNQIRLKRFDILSIYFVLAFLKTAMLGKMGVDENYFLDLTAASILLGGVGLYQAAKHSNKFKIAAWILILFHIIFMAKPDVSLMARREKIQGIEKSFGEFGTLLKDTKGDIIAENMGLLLGHGRDIVFSPFEFTQFAFANVWDETPFIERMERGEFPIVIMSFDISRIRQTSRFTSAFLITLKEHYKLLGAKHGQYFYVPKLSGKL